MTDSQRHTANAVAACLVIVAFAPIMQAQSARPEPKTGAEVLQRMHDAYAGKWYSTLTFTQKTTQFPPDKAPVVSTWYESLRYVAPIGAQLRIDTGDPSVGNGVLYTADSTWVVRAGKMTAARGGGNEFLPLIEGVYMQPVDRTVRELATTSVDMKRVTTHRVDRRRRDVERYHVAAVLDRHRAERDRSDDPEPGALDARSRHSPRELRRARRRLVGNENRDVLRRQAEAVRGVF
jgi:hypothetical protein